MDALVKSGDICPNCKRAKLVSSGGMIHCPNCKKGVADASAVGSSVEKLSKENEDLKKQVEAMSEDNKNLKGDLELQKEENEKLKADIESLKKKAKKKK